MTNNNVLPTILPIQPFMETGSGGLLHLHAPAKINLNLLVGPKRADNFHDLDSIIVRLSLYDQIDLWPRHDAHMHLKCSGAQCGIMQDNLAFRAGKLLAHHAATRGFADEQGCPAVGADMALEKHIPPGMGLGGGSSDAAAVLKGLDHAWKLQTPADELAALAAKLGSDVPLFLGPPSSRMTGRGEQLATWPVRDLMAILFLSDCFCSTADVYSAFDNLAARPADSFKQLQPGLFQAPPSEWRQLLVNDLEEPAMKVCPPLRQLRDELAAALPVPVHMTGSGGGLFVLCDDREELDRTWTAIPTRLRGICRAVSNCP